MTADDPVEVVRELKKQDGKDSWLIGGGALAGALCPEIDRLIVKTAPLTIGADVPLFGRDAAFDPRSWDLADHTVLGSGALFLTYTRSPTDPRDERRSPSARNDHFARLHLGWFRDELW
ncbi:dihydrofolate reductase [Actinomadura algeriensis]|uniref:Dihydrofolate reductase n=1 Tax=Actinomadura algeriensis TaxID=1679523 RepID=A0ABR9JKX3_9ACTN|nr:dihydrofolate reductase [Actinomadura algeriensis]